MNQTASGGLGGQYFNGLCWRCDTRNNVNIVEEAFASFALPMPPGPTHPTPLWGPGATSSTGATPGPNKQTMIDTFPSKKEGQLVLTQKRRKSDRQFALLTTMTIRTRCSLFLETCASSRCELTTFQSWKNSLLMSVSFISNFRCVSHPSRKLQQKNIGRVQICTYADSVPQDIPCSRPPASDPSSAKPLFFLFFPFFFSIRNENTPHTLC